MYSVFFFFLAMYSVRERRMNKVKDGERLREKKAERRL